MDMKNVIQNNIDIIEEDINDIKDYIEEIENYNDDWVNPEINKCKEQLEWEHFNLFFLKRSLIECDYE